MWIDYVYMEKKSDQVSSSTTTQKERIEEKILKNRFFSSKCRWFLVWWETCCSSWLKMFVSLMAMGDNDDFYMYFCAHPASKCFIFQCWIFSVFCSSSFFTFSSFAYVCCRCCKSFVFYRMYASLRPTTKESSFSLLALKTIAL